MRRLFYFLYRYKASIVFVLLASISLFLTVHEKFHETSASHAIGSIQHLISEIQNYPLLKEENVKLLQENAMLKNKLLQIEDPTIRFQGTAPYHLIPAQVINNSIMGAKNYLTLNKGAVHGVAAGMGVVSAEGIVGRVKAVSDHFATVTSVLHTMSQISAQISDTKVFGTIQWLGYDPCRAHLLYVPRHVTVQPGDAVVTSGYNATFFAGVLIGHVVKAKLREEAPFYDIELRLSTNFSTLQHVYVVDNALKQERVSLEQRTKDAYE